MPVIPASSGGQPRMRPPTTFDKWKMGAMLGGSVGLIMGFIFGGFNIMRYGAGPNGAMRTLGQYMLGSGATFGVIRTEGLSRDRQMLYEIAARHPVTYKRR